MNLCKSRIKGFKMYESAKMCKNLIIVFFSDCSTFFNNDPYSGSKKEIGIILMALITIDNDFRIELSASLEDMIKRSIPDGVRNYKVQCIMGKTQVENFGLKIAKSSINIHLLDFIKLFN